MSQYRVGHPNTWLITRHAQEGAMERYGARSYREAVTMIRQLLDEIVTNTPSAKDYGQTNAVCRGGQRLVVDYQDRVVISAQWSGHVKDDRQRHAEIEEQGKALDESVRGYIEQRPEGAVFDPDELPEWKPIKKEEDR